MALKDDNFFVIQGWMINKLDINNKELLVFALIHSFTQVDDTWFTGSINYIAECTKSSRSTTMNALSSLLEKQLIIREEVEVDFANYKYYKYRINRDKLDEILYTGIENNTPGVEITPVSVENTPNKYILSNNINNNNIIKGCKNDTGGDIDEIFEYWNSKGLIRHKKINKNIQEAISKALKEYEIDDILDAIDNYEEVVHDQTYFFDTIWPLDKFLKQQNALPEFLNEGAKWLSYANRKNGGVKGSFHSNGEQDLKFNTSNRRK